VIGSSGFCTYKSSSYSSPYSAPAYSYDSYEDSDTSCPSHSSESVTNPGKCTCNVGYKVNSSKTKCIEITRNTNDKACQADFGSKSKWNGKYDSTDGSPYCECKVGYSWDNGKTSCVAQEKTNESKTKTSGNIPAQLPPLTIKGYVKSVGDFTSLKCDGIGWVNQEDVKACEFYRLNKSEYSWKTN
jgi:hypothetical protein